MIKVGAKKGQINRHLYTILDIVNLKSLDFMHLLTLLHTFRKLLTGLFLSKKMQ
nr:MAG TPA: hypothetical protein [Caudoviricetes sp.]